jgi:CHAT domain-containing protein
MARGRADEAAQTLEAEICSSEGRNVSGGDRATAAEYAQLDHDLYAELAAAWLAQGRPPQSVLALWERFRMRSRGLPISQSNTGALDCEQPRLTKALRTLGDNILIGQILLLDRVLIYRVDRNGIQWSQKPLRRQDVLDSAQTFERAVSSPSTPPQTADKLGNKLGEALLPTLPDNLSSDATLVLEPDPQLQNLSWPVLPTPSGPLGIRYPLAELRSILVKAKNPDTANPDAGFDRLGLANGARALVVGASVASEGEPPLPEAITEAKSVNRILHSSELLLGKQATTASIAEELGSAPVFHFAGHAKQSVNGTELLLASASSGDKTPWIDGAFLRQHPPRLCRLAVLSACATGRRETAWKHPLQDIVETLGSLGVPEVVATRWQIDSAASVPFMDAFYQRLAQGNSVPLALTSARRVLSTRSMYRNPYYWGAYYDSGEETKYTTGELHARR